MSNRERPKPEPAKAKRRFAAIPPRARSDKRLTASDWRGLVAIACHDMLGKGQGCWASSATIAGETGDRPDSMRRTIARLIRFGYLAREDREGRTQRTLRIVHDGDSSLATCGTPCHKSAPRPVANDARPVAPHATQIDSPYGEREEIARSASSPHADSLRPSCESDEIRNSAEAASVVNDTTHHVDFIARMNAEKAAYPSRLGNDGEFYRYAKAWVQEQTNQQEAGQEQDIDLAEAERILDRLGAIEDAGDPHTGKGLPAAALRLHGELLNLLDGLYETENQEDGQEQDGAPPAPEEPADASIGRPVMPEEVADKVLAWLASTWPERTFTLSAAHKRGEISKRLLAATLEHLCTQGLVEPRGKNVYSLRSRAAP